MQPPRTQVSQRFLSRKSRFASGTPPQYMSPRRSATGSDALELGGRTGDSTPGTGTPFSLGTLTPASIGDMTPVRMESGLVRALTASNSDASTPPSHRGSLEYPGVRALASCLPSTSFGRGRSKPPCCWHLVAAGGAVRARARAHRVSAAPACPRTAAASQPMCLILFPVHTGVVLPPLYSKQVLAKCRQE